MTIQEWTLLDEDGETAVFFTSFIDLVYTSSGVVASYPAEEGSFVSYNKTSKPLDIKVTLAMQGTNEEFEAALCALDTYRAEAVTLSVASPAALYEDMTLETYTYTRSQSAGARILKVTLTLKEVREAKTVYSTPQNPTSTPNVSTGRTQTLPPPVGITGQP